jgi:Putative adhesin
MTNNESSDRSSDHRGGEEGVTSKLERHEVFEATGAAIARVTSSSGDVTIGASESNVIEVTLSIKDPAYRRVLDDAVIEFDAHKNALFVRTRTHENFNAIRGFRAAIRRNAWFEFGGSDPDVHIALPEGSSVEVTTASGDTEIIGVLAKATVSSASGNVSVADEVGVLEMKTASGDVTTATVRESLVCHSASGNVRCDGAGASTKIRTASGSVRLAVEVPSEISVRTVSGNVAVTVARGLEVDVDATSISGRLSSTMPLDGAPGGSPKDTVTISAKTVSGDVKVSSAA